MLCEICKINESQWDPPHTFALGISHCYTCWLEWNESYVAEQMHKFDRRVGVEWSESYVKMFQMWARGEFNVKSK